jgi:hypothetical protein
LLHTVVAGSATSSTTRRVSDTSATGAVNKPVRGATESVRRAGSAGSEPIRRRTGTDLRRTRPFLYGPTINRAHHSIHTITGLTAGVYICATTRVFASRHRSAACV